MDWLPEQFSPDREKAREAYRQFVAEGVGVQVWRGLKGGIFLGDDRFVEQLKGCLGRRASDREIPMAQRLAARPSLEELFADIGKDRRRRNRRIFEAVRSYGYTSTEVAQFLGMHYSIISRILKRLEGLGERKPRPDPTRRDPKISD